ncbi:DUF3148 domain-containing protein [Synechocystis sp. FACHB-383]|uniref:regulatory protein SipA n=1 Tax=Synechocystis sp. FACHB-383 TaxID=2692864 RepID=UPI00168989F7|nr:DUF3148 domain-containing protein [Synechocystis sp. FACHB-383]MBD2652264.1 DUF3148 domain-containing protein [Synechocystis sp. FACHB-383]
MADLFVGAPVRLIARPPYLKTADPMPMLRPPDLLAIAAEGMVVDRRPAGYWGVKFDRGIFLLESQYLEVITPQEEQTEVSG